MITVAAAVPEIRKKPPLAESSVIFIISSAVLSSP